MKTNEVKAGGLFQELVKVPFFQRGYVWTDKKWEPFFDVERSNKIVLEVVGKRLTYRDSSKL